MFRSLCSVFCVVVMAAFVFGCGGGGGGTAQTGGGWHDADGTDSAGSADRCATDSRCEASGRGLSFQTLNCERQTASSAAEFDTVQCRRHARANRKRRQSQYRRRKAALSAYRKRGYSAARAGHHAGSGGNSAGERENGSKHSEHSRRCDSVHPKRCTGGHRSQSTGNGRPACLDEQLLAHPAPEGQQASLRRRFGRSGRQPDTGQRRDNGQHSRGPGRGDDSRR